MAGREAPRDGDEPDLRQNRPIRRSRKKRERWRRGMERERAASEKTQPSPT